MEGKASDGTEIVISLTKDEISFDGETYAYKQNGTGFVNEARYYSLEVEVDETSKEQLTFILPEKTRKIGILLLPDDVKEPLSGTLLYAMNTEETPDYFEYAKKYMDTSE